MGHKAISVNGKSKVIARFPQIYYIVESIGYGYFPVEQMWINRRVTKMFQGTSLRIIPVSVAAQA